MNTSIRDAGYAVPCMGKNIRVYARQVDGLQIHHFFFRHEDLSSAFAFDVATTMKAWLSTLGKRNAQTELDALESGYVFFRQLDMLFEGLHEERLLIPLCQWLEVLQTREEERSERMEVALGLWVSDKRPRKSLEAKLISQGIPAYVARRRSLEAHENCPVDITDLEARRQLYSAESTLDWDLQKLNEFDPGPYPYMDFLQEMNSKELRRGA